MILTVFPEDNDRVDPVLLFKGKGWISTRETDQYSKQVKVFFTPKAVINTETTNKFIDYCHSKVSVKIDRSYWESLGRLLVYRGSNVIYILGEGQ